jgi:hypothetical protein
MTAEEFEGRGMTTGAAKKLHKKLEELKYGLLQKNPIVSIPQA